MADFGTEDCCALPASSATASPISGHSDSRSAMELEGLAVAHGPILLESADPGPGAALFHATVASGLAE